MLNPFLVFFLGPKKQHRYCSKVAFFSRQRHLNNNYVKILRSEGLPQPTIQDPASWNLLYFGFPLYLIVIVG